MAADSKTWARIERAARQAGLDSAACRTWRPAAEELTATQDTAAVLAQIEARPGVLDGTAFEVVGPLGEGGMGVVYEAQQRSLARRVALKTLRDDAPPARSQFLSEAQICGRLEHPHVLPVHALGSDEDGSPRLAMKLVTGASWHDLLHPSEGTDALGLHEHLRILRAVCLAMEYAHSSGILHRDLKPANVMVGDYEQIYVMDWGVAVAFDEAVADDSAILRLYEMPGPVGTPRYMAPELAKGDPAAQGPATDVFLLGGCLKEILDGEPPHGATTLDGLIEQALNALPPDFDEDLPDELVAIGRRALAAEPADRFPTVLAMREALDAYLEHRDANALATEGEAALERLLTAIEARDDREVHRLHAETIFAFDAALTRWSETPAAVAGQRRANEALLDHALRQEDLPLAQRLLPEVGDARRAEVDALAEAIAERERELERLRRRADEQDWSTVSGALSATFVVGGVLGGANAVLSHQLVTTMGRGAYLYVGGSWLTLTLVIGAIALRLLLRGLPKRVAPRVFGTWAAVGVANVVLGAIDLAAKSRPFESSHASALLVAVGFSAMAMQTRPWLLAPAVAWAAGAVAIVVSREVEVLIFGALWFATMAGVGIALRRGATLEPAGESP